MDKPRPGVLRAKRIKRLIYAVVVVVAASVVTYGLSRMKPAAPSVEAATLWMGRVERGPMLLDVRGLGTLVPEESRLVQASREGLVEQILVRPGDTVQSDTVLLILSNPELEQSLLDAELNIRAAEADLANTRAQLQNQLINQQASLAST